MKCPVCGDEDRQSCVGELCDRPLVIYRCEACDGLYCVDDDGDLGGGDLGGEEE